MSGSCGERDGEHQGPAGPRHFVSSSPSGRPGGCGTPADTHPSGLEGSGRLRQLLAGGGGGGSKKGVWPSRCKRDADLSLKISEAPTKSGAETSGAGRLPRQGQPGAKLEASAGLEIPNGLIRGTRPPPTSSSHPPPRLAPIPPPGPLCSAFSPIPPHPRVPSTLAAAQPPAASAGVGRGAQGGLCCEA